MPYVELHSSKLFQFHRRNGGDNIAVVGPPGIRNGSGPVPPPGMPQKKVQKTICVFVHDATAFFCNKEIRGASHGEATGHFDTGI